MLCRYLEEANNRGREQQIHRLSGGKSHRPESKGTERSRGNWSKRRIQRHKREPDGVSYYRPL